MYSKVGVIVEGLRDTYRIRKALQSCRVIETMGTRLNNVIKNRIAELKSECDVVIIMTDPDHAGNTFGDILQARYGFHRIILDARKCQYYCGQGKFKTGVEYADPDYIKQEVDALLDSIRAGGTLNDKRESHTPN